MPAAWKSTHPDVLAWWQEMRDSDEAFRALVKSEVEDVYGCHVTMHSGIGSHSVVGLSYSCKNERPPAGWRWGWGDRFNNFIEPMKGSRGAEARAFIDRLSAAKADIRKTAEDRFHVPSIAMPRDSNRIYSPAFFEHDGVVWLFWGDYDFDPEAEERRQRKEEWSATPVLDYFTPAKLSEYHAVRESMREGEQDE